MAYGPVKVFSVDMASGATFSSVADLSAGWGDVHIIIPSMASSSLYLQGSDDGETFYRVVDESVSSTVTSAEDFTIDSSCTNRVIACPAHHLRYLRVESTSGVTDTTTTFKFLCN